MFSCVHTNVYLIFSMLLLLKRKLIADKVMHSRPNQRKLEFGSEKTVVGTMFTSTEVTALVIILMQLKTVR